MTAKTLTAATDEVLEAGIHIVNTAKDEAGRWIATLEGQVKGTLEDLPGLPAQLEETVEASRQRVAAQAAAWRERSHQLWTQVLAQLKSAGGLLDGGVEPLVHKVGLASRGDVRRLEKKLARLSSQLKKLEQGR